MRAYVDFVIFEKVDRMGRWQIANLDLVETAYEQKVEVFFIDDGQFNYKDRGKRLSFNIKNIFAEDYSLDLEEKITKKQREAMFNNGKDTSTRPVLGLDPHPTKVGFYVLNQGEQNIVTDIFSKFVELQELFSTVRHCNEQGYKTKEYWFKERIDKDGNRIAAQRVGGEPFHSRSLRLLLTNPKLRGFGFFHDTWKQFPKLQDENGRVRWEYGHYRESGPVVSLDLFERAQRILEINRYETSKPKNDGEVYLLSGALQLPDGTRLVGASADGNGGNYRYYEDRRRGRRAELRIIKEEIEKAVCQRVKDYLKESGLLKSAIETTFSNRDGETAKIDQEIKAKTAQLSNLQRTLDGFGEHLRKAALSGELDRISAMLAAEQQKVDQEIQVMTDRIHALEQRKEILEECYEEGALQEKMKIALADFSKRCDLQKQQIIRAIVPKIIVHSDNRLEIQINPLFKKTPDGGDLTPSAACKPGGRRFVYRTDGDSGKTRTCDPLLRRQVLYPAELRSHR